MPLSSSLYVPGEISDIKEVLVDIGTGYFVSKPVKNASQYFDRKSKFIEERMAILEKVPAPPLVPAQPRAAYAPAREAAREAVRWPAATPRWPSQLNRCPRPCPGCPAGAGGKEAERPASGDGASGEDRRDHPRAGGSNAEARCRGVEAWLGGLGGWKRQRVRAGGEGGGGRRRRPWRWVGEGSRFRLRVTS